MNFKDPSNVEKLVRFWDDSMSVLLEEARNIFLDAIAEHKESGKIGDFLVGGEPMLLEAVLVIVYGLTRDVEVVEKMMKKGITDENAESMRKILNDLLSICIVLNVRITETMPQDIFFWVRESILEPE